MLMLSMLNPTLKRKNQMQNNVQMYYSKVYCDDIGTKAPDLFSKNIPEFITYRKMWAETVDGFMQCQNSDLIFFCTEGNIRIVLVSDNDDSTMGFNQFFMRSLDGKTVTIPKNSKFAINNIDNEKSAYIMGYFEEELDFRYHPKTLFDWKKN